MKNLLGVNLLDPLHPVVEDLGEAFTSKMVAKLSAQLDVACRRLEAKLDKVVKWLKIFLAVNVVLFLSAIAFVLWRSP